MSDFNYQPAIGPVRRKRPRVTPIKFGDGYEQRVADGINTLLPVWDLLFRDTKARIAAIDAFLESKNAVTAFTWTPTGLPEILVVCREWSRTFDGPTGTLTAAFEVVPA